MTDIGLESVLRRDRLLTGLALAVVVAIAWAYFLWFASLMGPPEAPGMDMRMPMDMPGMDTMASPALAPWAVVDVAFVATMWIAMMIGMMTPSVAPMILLYARVGRKAEADGNPIASSAWFAGGYLAAWVGFALLATGAQVALEQAALLNPMTATTSRVLGGIVLIVAGVYQWTPLKDACLGQCRAPLAFIQQHGGFRRDIAGSLSLGFRHGLYCVGCCWALMALLFVGGVMNPLWIAGIVALVLVEKLVPVARWIPRVAGVALVAAGVWVIATP